MGGLQDVLLLPEILVTLWCSQLLSSACRSFTRMRCFEIVGNLAAHVALLQKAEGHVILYSNALALLAAQVKLADPIVAS